LEKNPDSPKCTVANPESKLSSFIKKGSSEVNVVNSAERPHQEQKESVAVVEVAVNTLQSQAHPEHPKKQPLKNMALTAALALPVSEHFSEQSNAKESATVQACPASLEAEVTPRCNGEEDASSEVLSGACLRVSALETELDEKEREIRTLLDKVQGIELELTSARSELEKQSHTASTAQCDSSTNRDQNTNTNSAQVLECTALGVGIGVGVALVFCIMRKA
jgi:hypothetical protein